VVEPNSSHGSEWADQDSVGSAAENLAESATVVALDQLQQRLRNQTERIQNLEQALDQSIANLNELRSQIADQQFLEHQLASTEEIANVQQQAIHQLKLQFAEKQSALEQEIQSFAERERNHQALLEASVQSQQRELDQLRAQLSDRTESQERQIAALQSALEQQSGSELEATRSQITSLETQLGDAQKQIMRLYRELSDRHTAINELEARLEGDFALETIAPPPASEVSLPPRMEELEAQIAKHMANQALLQQACQELEVDRELSQTRIADLERQSAEMQEQILSQAQQASEYEAAVQHWKDRFYNSQEKVTQLKELLDEIPNLPPEVAELFAALQIMERMEVGRTFTTEPSNPDKIDLPDFLTRRRIYRNRT
jgi:chromosome segregation ATPase